MIKLFVFVAVCLVGSMSMSTTQVLDKPYYDQENAEDLFRDFVKEYEKSYSRKEYYERLEIFKENLKNINRQNANHPRTVFGVNQFTDLRSEEFQRYYYGLKPSNETGVKVVLDSSLVLPPLFDWREHNAVTQVKNQAGCGSCYIFSAIGNIEGQYAIKHQQCLALSEQQALDCLDCGSCNGGYMEVVMQELVGRAGVMREEDYPYIAQKYTCNEDKNKAVVQVLDGKKLDIPDEDTLMSKLVEIGPLAVGIAAGPGFGGYVSGVMYPDEYNCGSYISHGVVLVGYGEERDGTKYWIIKNSWGERWGEQGYLRLLRGVNACNMGTGYTASATVA